MKLKAKLTKTKGLLLLDTDCDVSSISDGFYTVDLKPYRSCRSLEQNSLLWKYLSLIAEETGEDIWELYINALENSNAEYEYITCLTEAEETLKKAFRAIKVMGTTVSPKGKELLICKVFIGSSKYDTKQMTTLIDYVIGVATELGIIL